MVKILGTTDHRKVILKTKEINLDSIDGSWKNSQESFEPKLIRDPTSVADKANF